MKSKFLKTLSILLATTLTSTILSPSIKAEDGKFSTSLTSEYIFTASGSSTIKQNFSVTNLTSHYLTSNYEVLFPGQLPNDLSGYDSHGKLTFQTEKRNSGTLVRIIFNSLAAGKDEVLNFTLTFSGPKASKHENVWEISVLPLANPDSISSYKLNLIIPEEMGILAYSSLPVNEQIKSETKNTTYTFSESVVAVDGLSATFGNFQTWGFSLNYQIYNPDNTENLFSILLPSDNVGQKISFKSIKPPPDNIEVVSTGNWIGTYSLKSQQTQNIEVVGQIRLTTGLSLDSSIPDPSIISFSSPGIIPPPELIRPDKSVIFHDTYSTSFPKISLDIEIPNHIFPSLINTAKLKITNSGNTAAYWVPISIQTIGISTDTQNFTIQTIPPFSTHYENINISFALKDLFSAKTILISTGNSYINYNVSAQKLTISYAIIIIIIALTILTVAGFTHRAGSIFVQRRNRKSNLHR